MTYELSADQATLRKRIRELAEGRILPRAEGIDEKAELPKGVLDDMAKYQWLSLVVPEDYAGAGASPLTVCAVIEEIARCCASSSQVVVDQVCGSVPLLVAGSHEQKATYFPQLGTGERLAALALSESGRP